VTERALDDLVAAAASGAGVVLGPGAVDQLVAYWRLLDKWNRRLNLTSLPLNPPSPAAVARLILEPVLASAYFPADAQRWYDLGSGGGSPAIPIKILHPGIALTMVESRSRKTAFLREVVRQLDLPRVEVLQRQFEDLPEDRNRTADIVTVRGVRADEALARSIRWLLKSGGSLFSFQRTENPLVFQGLEPIERYILPTVPPAALIRYVPRET
jgi:16S rRNA (guanine527-N7)-methyltransferase